MSKHIILCADDYGLNPAISLTIRELIQQERLSAVGCIVNFSNFKQEAEALLALKSLVAIGLHLNFTEGYALVSGQKFEKLSTLIIKSHLYRLSIKDLTVEIHAQLDCFAKAFGFLPDFIDGHQHVHQFPQLREALLAVYQSRLQTKPVRCTYPALSPFQFKLKSAILAFTGGMRFKKILNQRAIAHNPYFSGIYNFSDKACYRKLFKNWLLLAKDQTLIMCHPGNADPDYSDSIVNSRIAEFAYFSSSEFLQDCESYGITYKPTILKPQR